MSSAKRERVTMWVVEGVFMLRPLSLSDGLISFDRGSMVKLKRRQERGLPWHMPLSTVNFLLVNPFRIMLVEAFTYRDLMVLMRFVGRPGASRVFQR